MNLNDARRAFLEMIENATWAEHHNGYVDENGQLINRTTHAFEVQDRDLAILIDTLGFDGRIYETTSLTIQRHLLKTDAA